MENQQLKVPEEAYKYKGEFVVFFADEENPKLLFHSLISEEAYRRAEEIKNESGKSPVVLRVTDDQQSNFIKLMLVR